NALFIETSLVSKTCEVLVVFVKYFKNNGKNKSGLNFTEMEIPIKTAAQNHFPLKSKYNAQTKKKSITPSKWRFPVSSIMMNGFKKYQKMFLMGRFNRSNIFFPKERIPTSAKII